METLNYRYTTLHKITSTQSQVLVGVVASGQLEVLAEHHPNPHTCAVEIHTAAAGYGDTWQAVVTDFITRYSPGGLKFSINDGGARPDMVALRLAQACHAMREST